VRAAAVVHVGERLEELLGDVGAVFLAEELVLNDAVEELAAAHELEHEVDDLVAHVGLLHADEARVAEVFHDENLALKQIQIVGVLAELLERPVGLVFLVLHLVHHTAATFAQFLFLLVHFVGITFLVVR
jgi:hypothetical protein